MKKKIFSSLLLVAFTIAATSMFVSCKDYDDDINANASDIAALQTQLATLQSSLTAAQSEATSAHATLQTAINEASAAASDAAKEAAAAKVEAAAAKEAAATAKAEAIAEAIEQCKTLIANKADQEDLNALATRVASIESTLLTLPSNIATVDDVEAAKKNLQDQIDALNYLKEILPEGTTLTDKLGDIETLKETVAKLQDEIEAAQKSIGDLGESVSNLSGQLTETQKEIKKQMEAINKKVDNFITEINVLQYLLDKQVTSLVLKPTFYHSGIEAIEYPTIQNFRPIIINEKTQGWVYTSNKDSIVNIANIGIAQYHVNPTSADLTGYNIDFYGNVAESRSGVSIIEPVNKVADTDFIKENYVDGILSVPFTVPAWEKWNTIYGDGILPMVALQLSKESATNAVDSVITSDYGVVNVTNYNSLYLANNIWKGTDYAHSYYRRTSDANSLGQVLGAFGHVRNNYTSVKPANDGQNGELLKNYYDFTVRYDKSLDLSEYIRPHYSYTSSIAGESSNIEDREMNDIVFKALGLKYKYTAIDYTLGSNKTSESQHIKVDSTGICTPVKVNLEGKRTDEQADRASVGRLPIVRIELLDSNDNVLAIGFVLIKIVEDEVVKVINQTLDGKAYIDCNAKGEAAAMTWAQFENNILSELGLSRESFEAGYSPDTRTGWSWNNYKNGGWSSTLVQFYEADETKHKDVPSTGEEEHPIIGTVKYIADFYIESSTAQTPTIAWQFTEKDLETLKNLEKVENTTYIKNGKTVKDLVTYVRFTGASNVYVKLTLPAGSLLYVSGTIKNKVLAQWYQLNTKTKAEANADAKDVHINVPVPEKENSAALTGNDFTKDLQELFIDKKVKIDGINEKKFSQFINQAQLSFEFTTPSISKGNAEFDATEYANGTYWSVTGESQRGSKEVYVLTVKENSSNGNSEIHAVTINENGEITSDLATIVELTPTGQITYKDNNIAKDILNYASHNDLKSKETFSAYIQIKYTACYEAEIQDNSEYFNARFLRPVNLNAKTVDNLKDAPNGIQYVPKSSLYGLTDWRDYTLVDEYTKTTPFTGEFVVKSYYGAKVSFGEEKDLYTDMNLGQSSRTAKDSDDLTGIRKLTLVTSISGLKFEPKTIQTQAEVLNEDGTVKTPAVNDDVYVYKNNEANVGTFHIYVPVYLNYTWGTQTRYAVVTVTETIKQPTE